MKLSIIGPAPLNSVRDLLGEEAIEKIEAECTDTLTNGLDMITSNARAAVLAGFEVHLILPSRSIKKVTEIAGEKILITVFPRSRRKFREIADLYYEERRAVLKALKKFSPNLIHAHWAYEYLHAASMYGKSDIITSVHDNPIQIFLSSKGKDKLYRFVRMIYSIILLRRTTNRVFVSHNLMNKIIAWIGKKNDIVVHNGVIIPATNLLNTNSSIRIISVSNGFNGYKNTKALIRAYWEVAKNQEMDVCLDIIGSDHEYGGKAFTWAAENGSTEGINFHGSKARSFIDEMYKNYRCIYVHPSLEESFGLSPLEALAHGVPIIAGQSSGAIPEVMGRFLSVKLIDVKQHQKIADYIIETVNNYQKIFQSASIDREIVERDFNITKNSEIMINIYRRFEK